MKLDYTVCDAQMQLAIDGRLDTLTAPELESFLSQQYDQIQGLTIDCKGLTYISSAGLRVLLSAQKQLRKFGAMKLINVCADVMEVFEMTGFADILVIA